MNDLVCQLMLQLGPLLWGTFSIYFLEIYFDRFESSMKGMSECEAPDDILIHYIASNTLILGDFIEI
jgi:hypothetical protein